MGIKRFVLFVTLLGMASMVPGFRDFGLQAAGQPRPVVRFATRTDTTAPLREMPEIPPMPDVLGEIFEKALKRLPNRAGGGGGAAVLDPVAQTTQGASETAATGESFDGLGIINGVLPPDPAGAIGLDHYVQMTNLSFAIWDRAGTLLYGPANNNTLWQNFGGPCETTNDGDPIVLYDHLAKRWMMSQFALPNFPRGPFIQCIAISQGSDPTLAWNRYEFLISNTNLNDYPKFGVWPDGYYMAVNQFNCRGPFCSWGGQGVVAFERDKMLSGDPSAQMIYFDMGLVDLDLGGMLPADLDGPVPPAGAPNPFVMVDDNAWGNWPDRLQIWNFHVDWADPGNSTFTHDKNLTTESFDSNLCGYSRNCIPQPGGTDVDAISDRLMYRLQYRNFQGDAGSDQAMVVNHTVDVDGNDRAGIRWYELRKDDTGSDGWTIYQQGTYAPAAAEPVDNVHRWMGSIAMNGDGQIALGYSVSNDKDVFPSIRYTGRLGLDGEPLGEMTVTEGEIVAGGGYQTHSSGRWGDYSMLTVDPSDDCTFWYTQEYYAVSGNAPWRTRIGSFQLADCAPVVNDPNNDPPTANDDDLPITNEDTSVIIDVLANDSDLDTLSVASVTQGSHGSVTNNGANVTYTPDLNFNGLDSFTYTASDGNGGTDTAMVTVTVNAVNDAPVAGNDAYVVNKNVTLSVAAPGVLADDSDVDGDSLTAVLGTGPPNGGLTLNPDGSFEYTPNTNFIGGDSFTYTAYDGTDSSTEATVTIAVNEPASGPTVESCNPPDGNLNQRLPVTVSGSGFQDGATVDFGARIAVQGVTFVDATELTVRIKIQRRADLDARDVIITNPDGRSGTGTNCFTVNP